MNGREEIQPTGIATPITDALPAARLDHLDLLRGIAALLVCTGHLRAFVFETFAELHDPGLATKSFYFATGLGHQSVIVFFALSGFLVGGKALADLIGRQFTLSGYLVRRLVRLWIVIVPALLLTLVLDSIGLALTGGVGYDGRYFEMFNSGPRPSVASGAPSLDLSLTAFIGNLAFLQDLYTPIFGSNGPMWSLANEFWYYVTFPFLAWVLITDIPILSRLVMLALVVALFLVLPGSLWIGGAIWVAGAAAAWCAHNKHLAQVLESLWLRLGAAAAFLVIVALSKVTWSGVGDLHLGLATVLLLPVLARLPSPAGIYRNLARALSEISYTLYLTHFPLLMLVVLAGLAPTRFPPNMTGALIFTALLALALAWAIGVWWCFERNTDRVHGHITRLIGFRRQPSIAMPAETRLPDQK